jgi:SH3 domain-containing protein
VKTFIALALVAVVGLRAAAEQPRTTNNPCMDKGNPHPRLLPVDEGPSSPDFFNYRAQLQMAVERRDVDALIEASDSGIRLGFDASGGADALRKRFADRSESWDELRTVLARGGRFTSPTSFSAPYVYSNWPERFDSFECAAITGTTVRVRSEPRLDASILTSVSYSIVRVIEPAGDHLWSQVQLGDGRRGYMWHAYVRSPVDYRALFNLVDGRWRMTAFVAGD